MCLKNPPEENKVISLITVTNEILKGNQFKVGEHSFIKTPSKMREYFEQCGCLWATKAPLKKPL